MTLPIDPQPLEHPLRLRQNVAFALAIASHLFLWGVYASLAATNAVGRDAGAFLLAGRLLVRGVPLYQGVWDHKGPVVYLVNALGTSVTRDSIAGVLLLECVMISAALLWFQRVFWKASPRFVAVLSAAAVLSLLKVQEGGDLTETLAFPVQLAVYVTFWRVVTSATRRRLPAHALVGAGVAWCALLRPNNALGVSLIAAALLLFAMRPRRWKDLGGLFAGAALVVIPILALLVSSGSVNAFVDQFFTYNFAYSAKASAATHVAGAANLAFIVAKMPLAMLAVASLARPDALRHVTRPVDHWERALLGALVVDSLSAFISGNAYPHYLVTVIPAWMVVCILRFRGEMVPPQRRSFVGTLALSLFLASAAWAIVRIGLDVRAARAQGRTDAEVSRRIQLLSGPSDPVLVYGAEPKYNFLSGRPSPSEYAYQYALLTPGYGDAVRVARFTCEVEAAAPALIVDAHTPGFCPLATQCKPPAARSPTSDEIVLAEFRKWVAKNYWSDDPLGGLRILQRKSPGVGTESSRTGCPSGGSATRAPI